jgi:hypothetical protein
VPLEAPRLVTEPAGSPIAAKSIDAAAFLAKFTAPEHVPGIVGAAQKFGAVVSW